MDVEYIKLYRVYHSFVKSSLIQQITNDAHVNVQIGSEVSDIHHWDRHYSNKLCIIEKNNFKLKQIMERYHKMKIKKDIKFENDYIPSVKDIDNIFITSLNPFCVSEMTMNAFLQKVSKMLKDGGYCVGILMDESSVLELLAGNHFYKNNAGFIKKIMFDDKKYGHSIKLGLPNKLFLNERTIDIFYLSCKDSIVSLAKKHNLELVFWKRFNEYSIQCKKYIRNDYRLFIELYSSFMFKKTA